MGIDKIVVRNWAEGEEMLFDLHTCASIRIYKIMAEADSQLLVASIKEVAGIPWRMLHTMDMIKEFVKKKEVIVQHCYKGANKVADTPAAFLHTHQQHLIFTNFEAMQRQIRGLAQLDKLIHLDMHSIGGIPYFFYLISSFRYTKNIELEFPNTQVEMKGSTQ